MIFALLPFFARFLTLTLNFTVFDLPGASFPGFRHFFGTLTSFFGPLAQSLSFLAVASPMFLTLTLNVAFLPRLTFLSIIGRILSLNLGFFAVGSDRSTGAPNEPPGGRVAAWMMRSEMLSRSQTAVAVPSGAAAICGRRAFPPSADRSTGAPNEPPGGRVAAWMMRSEKSEPGQTAVAVPSGAVVICG